MGKNNKPILSVLVDAEKKELFADLARRHKQSMGWVLNDCIDRMLAAGSIDIYSNSVGNVENTPNPAKIGQSVLDIEEIVKAYIDKYLLNNSVGLTHQEVRDIAASTIKDSIAFEKLVDGGEVIKIAEGIVNSTFNPLSQHLAKLPADTSAIEQLVTAKIDPVAELVDELQIYTQNQIAAVRNELKKACGDRDRAVEIPDTITIPENNMSRQTSIDTQRKHQPKSSAKTAPSGDSPTAEIVSIVKSFDKNPELKAMVASGLAQGFVGTALGNWLADGGFLNTKGEHFDPARLSKFKTAIEWLEKQNEPNPYLS